jgi:hypothetical protein
MAFELTTSYIKDSLSLFRYYKGLADKAMAQVSDERLLAQIDEESNSIALIAKHMSGNMQSRFTDFLTSDPAPSREALLAAWEAGWACLFATLEALSDDDLARTVTIRGEAHSVMQAINRQVAHYGYHVGQIVLLAKYLNHAGWKSLSVPRGQSEQWTERVREGRASSR